MVTVFCPNCNTQFKVRNYKFNNGGGGFCSRKCVWEFKAERFHYIDKMMTLKQLSNLSKIPFDILKQRIKKYGWTVEKAITTNIFPRHGLSHLKIFGVWNGMIQRCENKNQPSYKNYGARGIKVCEEWKTFLNFFNDMSHDFKVGLTLDRKNNMEGYSKRNCRWVTWKVQARNRRKQWNSVK